MRSAEYDCQERAAADFNVALSKLDSISHQDRAILETEEGRIIQIKIAGIVGCVLQGVESDATLEQTLKTAVIASGISEHALRTVADFARAFFICGNLATGGAPLPGESKR